MRHSIIRIICFTLILCAVLTGVNEVFKFKYGDGIYDVTKFYQLEDNSVDVLILGSSHAFENINTGTLWDEYGIASYILGGSVQPLWNTYYYLKEALKTQKPKLVVLEMFSITSTSEFIDDSRIIKNTYGLKRSIDKINSIKVSSPKERWSEFILEYIQYHTRYTELSAADFLYNQNNRLYDDWKGFGCNMGTNPLEVFDVSGVIERTDIYEKAEKYYRMIINLAQENGIPIIAIVSPYANINSEEQKIYNSAEDIANEYGISFVNFNLINDVIGLDYNVDAADGEHLNYKGNQKYSKYLGEYLKSQFSIPDRRGDNSYQSWQRGADYIRQMIYDQELIESIDSKELFQKLINPNYWVIISVNGNCDTSDSNVVDFLHSVGIYELNANGIWLLRNNEISWSSTGVEAEYYKRSRIHDFYLHSKGGGKENTVIIDNVKYNQVENGIDIVVYDTLTEKIVTSFGIDMNNNYSLKK